MRFTITKSELTAALDIPARVSKSNPIPVMECVVIDANEDGVEFTASDLSTFAKTQALATVEERGTAAVNARLLLTIAKQLPDGAEIAVALSGDKGESVTIKCNGIDERIQTMDAEDFPKWPEAKGPLGTEFTVEREDLIALIDVTTDCTPTKDPRRSLLGVLFEVDGPGETLTCVGTDGKRLAQSAAVINGDTVSALSGIVPRSSLADMRPDLTGGKEPVVVKMSGEKQNADRKQKLPQVVGWTTFEFDRATVMTGMINDPFPDYRRIIPDEHKIEVTVSRERLNKALKRAAVMADERSRSVVLKFTTAGLLTVSSMSYAVGDHSEEMDCNSSADIELALNWQFGQDALKAFSCDEIRLRMNTPVAPVKIEDPSGADNHLIVLMPIKITDEKDLAS